MAALGRNEPPPEGYKKGLGPTAIGRKEGISFKSLMEKVRPGSVPETYRRRPQ